MPTRRFELPPEKAELHGRAVRIEWLTIAYTLSAIFFLYLTIGSSQAGRAALVDDVLALTPPIAFLIATRIRNRPPDDAHPWGYHRSVSIAYLTAALSLLVFGAFILIESVVKLVVAERTPIGVIELFGEPIWLGWVMLPALAWSGIPSVLLGRAKLPLAAGLHDKVLYADAKMNKANWLAAAAAAVGVIGIGFGLWWLDAVAAIAISLDIVHDGYTNVRSAVDDLMDSRPTHYDDSGPHPLIGELEDALREMDWVEDAQVRLREEGHVFTGEALIVPIDEERLVGRLEDATRHALSLDWRLHDVVVVPVTSLDARPAAPNPQVTDERAAEATRTGPSPRR